MPAAGETVPCSPKRRRYPLRLEFFLAVTAWPG
jgi:hypothetical protein